MKTDSTQPSARTTADPLSPFRDLEDAMYEALLMVDLAADVVDGALSDRSFDREILGRDDAVYLTERQADQLIFATGHAAAMVRGLRDAYVAAFTGGAAR